MLSAHSDYWVGKLTHQDLPQALEFAQRFPVECVLLAERLARAINTGFQLRGGNFWVAQNVLGEVVGLCWHGVVTIVAVAPHAAARFAQLLAGIPALQRAHSSSIVGPAEAVLPLWEMLSRSWPQAREVRAEQPSMELWLNSEHGVSLRDPGRPRPTSPTSASAPASTQVRLAKPGDFELLLPACVAMFTEEVGYIPDPDPQGSYGLRVRSLVSQQRAYLMLDEAGKQVLFKTEVGAMGMGVSQLQGVWVSPQVRGTGVGTAALSQMLDLMSASGVERVSLYVNGYNSAALSLYRRLGFTQVGTFATVLF